MKDQVFHVTADLTALEELDADLGKVYEVKSGEYFEGPYEVTPAVYEQSLPTARKLMREDVTVFEIPYAEVSNIHGTTVTIAS